MIKSDGIKRATLGEKLDISSLLISFQDFVSSNAGTVTDAGTEAYLAPEVLAGKSGESDPFKIDVWALGTDDTIWKF